MFKNESFLVKNEVFLVKNEVFLVRNESFLVRNESFLVRNESFLVRNEVFLVRNESFLVKNEVFLPAHKGKIRRAGLFLGEVNRFYKRSYIKGAAGNKGRKRFSLFLRDRIPWPAPASAVCAICAQQATGPIGRRRGS
jgi:hypothetical protein